MLILAGAKVTTALQRAIQDRRSWPIANLEFFKNVIDIPQGWTAAVYHSSSPPCNHTILLNGLMAGGNRQERSQTSTPLLGRASSAKQISIGPEKLATTDRFLRSSQVASRHSL